jgi:hypothetical protein
MPTRLTSSVYFVPEVSFARRKDPAVVKAVESIPLPRLREWRRISFPPSLFLRALYLATFLSAASTLRGMLPAGLPPNVRPGARTARRSGAKTRDVRNRPVADPRS